MPEPEDFNTAIIREFRSNAGQVGGPFEGAPVLLLHSTGAKSGAERVHPVMYQPVGDDVAIFASKGGAPNNPDWYHNLVANPRASVEVGETTYDVDGRVAQGQERTKIWEKQKAEYPQFAEYERQTSRTIPVVVLSRVP